MFPFMQKVCLCPYSLFALANVLGTVQSIDYITDVPSAVVNLGIVCDMEFTAFFGNDTGKIYRFLDNEIQDLGMYFATLKLTRISFQISSVVFINNTSEQPFVENARNQEGLTEPINISTRFEQWTYSNENLSSADLVILITGSKGPFISYSGVGVVCKQSQRKKQNGSVVVIRLGKDNWYGQELVIPVARALGAQYDADTECKGEQYAMASIWSNPSSYFFSNCSDESIARFVLSSTCLQNSTFPISTRRQNRTRNSLTIQERCQIQFNQSDGIVVTDNEEPDPCFCSDCYVVKHGNWSLLGNIYPVYNTPCGDNKFCFRGRCLPKGIVIQNVNSRKCLLGTNRYTYSDPVTVHDCPNNPNKLDEFMILENKKYGFYLATPISTENNDDKCLTIDSTGNTLVFEKCPVIPSEKFGWDFYSVNGSLRFYLVHRVTQKYVSVGENGNLKLKQNGIHSDSHNDWMIYNLSVYPEDELRSKLFYNTSNLPNTFSEVKVSESNILSSVKLPDTEVSSVSKFLVLVVVLVGIALAGVIFTIVYMRKRKNPIPVSIKTEDNLYKETGDYYVTTPTLRESNQGDILPCDAQWEFPVEQLIIGKQLGSGAFGCVYKAEAFGLVKNSPSITVAVKSLPMTATETQINALMSELNMMSHLGRHINIVNLLGACTKQISNRKLFVILEFCENGNLRSYLHRHRTDNFESNESISVDTMILWAFHVAKGMEYLTHRRILHGDLAARNCLVAKDKIVKICDFGLSRNLQRNYDYNYKKDTEGSLLPFKWMAVESMKLGIFSSKSDCWSFGVLLWEIFTFGGVPYPGMAVGSKFVDDINNGLRMERPELAPIKVYDIMKQCWDADPHKRPSFSSLVMTLGRMLEEDVCEKYFQLCSDYELNSENDTDEDVYTTQSENYEGNWDYYLKVYESNDLSQKTLSTTN